MIGVGVPEVQERDPKAVADLLETSDSAAMVDVRTRAEWAFTGLADISATKAPLWTVEWVTFPDMAPNTQFLEQLVAQAGGSLPRDLYFICRSGARSMAAARTVAAAAHQNGWSVTCTNVAEGFEGDLDASSHRGTVSGWKARGLPWRQN